MMKLLSHNGPSAQFSSTAAKRRLISMLLIFATALFIPLAILANHVYNQFESEMYYDYKWNAEKLVKFANKYIYQMMSKEEERPFDDYQFYKWVNDPLLKKKDKTKSPLAHPQKIKHIPGFIGHFQIDANDKFSSPILPNFDKADLKKKVGMEWEAITERLELQYKIEKLLIENDFLALPKVKPAKKQSADNKATSEEEYKQHTSRTEEAYISSTPDDQAWQAEQTHEANDDYMAFVVEIDPFQFKRSKDGYYFFYRKVWRQNKRYVQGFVVDEDQFLAETIKPLLAERNFQTNVTLQLIHDLQPIKEYQFIAGKQGCEEIIASDKFKDTRQDKLIDHLSLIQPLNGLAVALTTTELPLGPGSDYVDLLLLVVSAVIAVGLITLYKAGHKQILLAEERLNFVSAVSHELKTPLTSILMYSEMLREGMVTNQEKRHSYYDFIFFESERLSRLISNVLQLSKLGKNTLTMEIEGCSMNRLTDLIRSKTSTLLSKNQFDIDWSKNSLADSDLLLAVDQDAFAQIVINLVDNAIKFSIIKEQPDKTIRKLEVGFKNYDKKTATVVFFVRDFGPGIDPKQCKKVFDLFYRIGNEMTRTTPGTGIGLALVNELAHAMNGQVAMVNLQPGIEAQVILPVASKRK